MDKEVEYLDPMALGLMGLMVSGPSMGLRPETPCGKQKAKETLLLPERTLLRAAAVAEEEEEKRGGAPLVHGLVTENLLKIAS